MRPSEQYEAAWTLANEAVDYVDARSWRVRWLGGSWAEHMTHELALAMVLCRGRFTQQTDRSQLEATMRTWLRDQTAHYGVAIGWVVRMLIPIIVRLVLEWWFEREDHH